MIWDALKAICETIELEDRYVIIESAGIIVAEEVGLIVIVDFLVYSFLQAYLHRQNI